MSVDPVIAAFAAGLDADAREFFEERSVIVVYEEGLSRNEVERMA
ncbi:hypothetical protein [Thiocystis violacea]|nr:hypothetical protein [Thiocystis violacea]